jgi:hypothetical protein
MARTSKLRVHVQVDRLPDVPATFVQLGIRVSAAIVPGSADDGAIPGDESRILPWKWIGDTKWTIWRRKAGSATLEPAIPDADVTFLTRTDAGADTFERTKFQNRVDDEVGVIIGRVGHRQALEIPALDDGVLSGRTAFGLAESLTSLPNPVPIAMNVWIAATIDQTNLADFKPGDRFVALPTFAVTDASYIPENVLTLVDGVWKGTFTATTSGTDALQAIALVHSSLPMSELEIGSSTERMIDASQLLIRAPEDHQFESADWIASAGLRIAEAIDPAARAMSVLDATIDQFVRTDTQARRQALIDDVSAPDVKKQAPDLLRQALKKLHLKVVARRALRTESAMAPAAAFVAAIAERAPEQWPTVIPILFAQAGAEDELTLPSTPLFDVASCSRILGAAGVPPSPSRVLADATKGNVPLLDTSSGFVDWILRHWLDAPKPAETKKIVFDGVVRGVKPGDDSTNTELTSISGGVARFTRVPRPAKPIAIPIRIGRPTLPATVTVTFRGTRGGASVAVKLGFLVGDKLSIEVPGIAGPQTIDTPKTLLLSFKVDIPAPNTEPSLSIELTPVDKPMVPVASIPKAAPLILSGAVSITLESVDQPVLAGIDMSALPIPSIDRDPLIRQAGALRGLLSWAYASHLVPPLLQGWAPIVGEKVPRPPELPLAARLEAAAGKFIDASFREQFNDAKVGLTGALLELFDLLQKNAVKDANDLIAAVVPPSLEDGDRLTGDAQPLAFLIAQLQDFDPNEDLWGRLAGVGVLISRDPEINDKKWWSLNAATLHITTFDADGNRDPLGEGNAVRTAVEIDHKWQIASKVDPVPLTVGDVDGVRAALVKYENHSIVGELEGSPQLDPAGATTVAQRRPEAYFFPTQNFTRMPALTFGREYGILPYLIGHGGALPLALRAKKLNPVKLVDITDNDSFVIDDVAKPPGDYVYVRKTKYLRTVPVSAPRIAEAQWPGTFPGVDPLADELPLRPPPVTIRTGDPARFFIDKERLTGLLAARGNAIRIDLGQIGVPTGSAGATLEIRVESRDSGDKPPLSVSVEIAKLQAAAAGSPFGLRIEAEVESQTKVSLLKRREMAHADDEPDASVDVTNVTMIERHGNVEAWQGMFITVNATVAPIDVEPPTIRWGALTGLMKLVLEGDRPVLPPELAHGARKVAVLDGIKAGSKTGPTRLSLALRRPAAPLATYERWINGPTGNYPDPSTEDTKKNIRLAINGARERSTTLGKGDRSLDDPAVESMFVEVVQLFPRRFDRSIDVNGTPIAGPVQIGKALSNDLLKLIGLKEKTVSSTDFAKITADVGPKLFPDKSEDSRVVGSVDKDGNLALTLAPGCIYELRVYAAVPLSQSLLAPALVTTEARFSPAVRASWRDVRDANGNVLWHLGTPLTLTMEVATEIMPECWPRDGVVANPDTTKPLFDRPIFAIAVQRPPRVMEDRATVRLVPENAGPPIVDRKRRPDLTYPALRYVNRAALMHQRWSWRGRPQAEFLLDDPTPEEIRTNQRTLFGTEGKLTRAKVSNFVDAAFLERADDDIGPIREVSFSRAHASGGKDTMEPANTSATRPVLLEHDLDHRAGTNLWRFALRLTSRYAPMRPNHPDLLRFSHVQKEAPQTQWWRLVVPDRVHPERPARAVARPGLMLVLPLTETEMTGGSVPPLLAVFNQELFPHFNAADGIEAVIDVARHPLPGADRLSENQKPKADQNTTFGKLFEDKWKAVIKARTAFEQAQAKYADAVSLDSTKTGEQPTRESDLTTAAGALEKAEDEFKTVQVQAGGWGVFEQWKAIDAGLIDGIKDANDEITKDDLIIANANSTPEEKADARKRKDEAQQTIINLQERRLKVAIEITAAEKAAGEIEKAPVVPGGPPVDPHTKYFQEIAPDPIRTAAPAADRPVAVRVDGPIGYTFDAGVEAGRFDHSALLVSPVAEVIRPGSFVRLRFRRLEAPGLLIASDSAATSPDQPASIEPPISILPHEGARFLIENPAKALPQVAADVHLFHTVYEGLAFDVLDLAKLQHAKLRFKLATPRVPAKDKDAEKLAVSCIDKSEGTTVDARIEETDGKRRIIVFARTHLGVSATWSLPVASDASIRVQAIVSLRSRPVNLDDKVEKTKTFVPVADVSVRVRIDRNQHDSLLRPQENSWLSVLCMPLTTKNEFLDLVAVQACPDSPDTLPIAVTPMRLSDFTPGVWAQFAAVMSRFRVEASTGSRKIEGVFPVSALNVKLAASGDTFELSLNGLREGETLTSLRLRTEGEPDDAAQIEEPVYAVVTRFVYDAFDRLRERAIGIHPLVGSSLTLGPRVWPKVTEPKVPEPYANDMRGRVRFLRVVRGKVRGMGGFESALQEFPNQFFGRETDDALDAEPLDAAGMAMGISAPIEWGNR